LVTDYYFVNLFLKTTNNFFGTFINTFFVSIVCHTYFYCSGIKIYDYLFNSFTEGVHSITICSHIFIQNVIK
jgi:hypothetical protein